MYLLGIIIYEVWSKSSRNGFIIQKPGIACVTYLHLLLYTSLTNRLCFLEPAYVVWFFFYNYFCMTVLLPSANFIMNNFQEQRVCIKFCFKLGKTWQKIKFQPFPTPPTLLIWLPATFSSSQSWSQLWRDAVFRPVWQRCIQAQGEYFEGDFTHLE